MDFSNIATLEEYVAASFLAREAAQEMLQRLQLMKLQPQQVVDIGCGTGVDAHALAWHYPQAKICGIDLAQSFLNEARKQREERLAWVLADSHTLPLRAQSVDLIFANLLLPWVSGPVAVLREWRRVLRPNGLVLFSCLGPDTFTEWQTIENAEFLPHLVDMHHVGDAVLAAGLIEPVLEVEHLTLTYRSQQQCRMELEKIGMYPQGALKEAAAPQDAGVFSVTVEVVYGHAWCPAVQGFKPDDHGVVRIPVSQLKK